MFKIFEKFYCSEKNQRIEIVKNFWKIQVKKKFFS